jgi:hypothetical protein
MQSLANAGSAGKYGVTQCAEIYPVGWTHTVEAVATFGE